MPNQFKVSFDDPEHGWVRLTLAANGNALTFMGSFTPGDSFLELANALYHLLLYSGEATVTWNTEPAEFDLRFSRTENRLRLEVHSYPDRPRDNGKGMQVFEASGTYDDVCLPFWRALRNLQGRFSPEELDRRWCQQFPSKEIDDLTSALRQRKW